MRPRKVELAAWKTIFAASIRSLKGLPDGVQGGKPSLDGVWRPRRFTVGVSDTHRDRLRSLWVQS